MKKILMALATLALTAGFISCQKDGLEPNNCKTDSGEAGNCEITAVLEKSKVSYSETGEKNLQPAWETADVVFGFDAEGNTYTFTVYSISGERATLRGEAPANVALHLIHAKGYTAENLADMTLNVSYVGQKGDKSLPAVMVSDGEIKDGSGEFTFSNAGAVIGISAVKGIPQGTNVTKITVSGENLSAATVSLDDSALTLTAEEKADDSISVEGLNLTVNDADGTLSAPVLIAVPAGAKIAKVTVPVTKEPETMKKPSTTPQEGVDYVTIGGKKWAKWNIGASTETDYGWYFAWGDTEGYVWYADTWQSAEATSAEFSYSPAIVRTAEANGYMYVKTQTFKGYSFDWANAPFNNGSSEYDATYFSSVKETVCPGDILAYDYDAARANWGGSWHMPTYAEIQALYEACINGDYDTSTYASTPCGEADTFDKGIYWCGNYDGVVGGLFCDGTNKLFLPAAGSGIKGSLYFDDFSGFYWSGALDSSSFDNSHALYFYPYSVEPQNKNGRCHGFQVRPVTD